MIREITARDIGWISDLCHRRYDMTGYDEKGGLVALTQAMRLDTAIAWRTDHGFLVANITTTLWAPRERTLHVLALCVEEGHHWAAIELLRESIEWARGQDCRRWLFNSDTDHRVAALAFRVGARRAAVYEVNFAEASE